MITSVRIHPAIGICRVGNSPDEFFIAPERPWETPSPPGGFKDAQCRVKRQATRFRVFAYDENGVATELTAADADISWTVHLRNTKAVQNNPTLPPADMAIDPGPRTLTAPNQAQAFDTGTISFPGVPPVVVPLGEVRTDADGRLVVLGGFGHSASPTGKPPTYLYNEEWFDDVSDGPVTATVTVHGTGETFDAEGAWVITGPPKFAPQLDNVITLYDRLYDLAAGQGWVTPPAVPSYTEHIYPILLHAAQSRWVENVPDWAHGWTQPVTDPAMRAHIYSFLRPQGTMPELAGGAQLTDTQLAWMLSWKDGNFVDDWAGPPQPPADVTADGLDRAALGGALGASFAPGIEAGWFTLVAGNYSGPFRFDPAVVTAGDVTAGMSCPWQADFYACGNWWWPVPRPNWVIPQGQAARQDWDRGVGDNAGMVALWHALGFVVQDGAEYVEVDRCPFASITLLTPSLFFDDIPQGPLNTPAQVSLPIAFEVSYEAAQVVLEVQQPPLNPRLTPSAPSIAAGPTLPGQAVQVELWITYETGPSGEMLQDEVVMTYAPTGQSWTIPILASTAVRKGVAVALVLDRSGSMAQDRGDGQPKIDSLRQAAANFVDAMLEGDGVALVRYDHDAQLLQPVTPLGPVDDPADPAREGTKLFIDGSELDPAGATSIGDGVFEGRAALNAVSGEYEVRSLVVLTDGMENSPKWLDEVAADIDARTYAVGFGTPQNTSAAALQKIAAGTGGFLLVTGEIGDEEAFILQKYFLQILAGVSNAQVVLDPSGSLLPGEVHRIPFTLSDADGGVDVFLLTPDPEAVDFRLQTPNGFLLEPWRAGADPRIRYVHSRGMAYYRVALPAELRQGRLEREGTWHVVLTPGAPRREPPEGAGGLAPAAVAGGRPDARSLEAALADPAYDRAQSHPYPAAVRGPARRAPHPVPGTRDVRSLQAAAARDALDRAASSRPLPDAAPPDAAGAAALPGTRQAKPLPYSVIVHAYSSVALRCTLRQDSREPGAAVWVDAVLTESGMPVADAQVRVEVARPDRVPGRMALEPRGDGTFSGTFVTSVPGVYRLRVRAGGTTRRGHPIQREQTLTVPVWIGGDAPPPRDRPESGAPTPGGSGSPGGGTGGGPKPGPGGHPLPEPHPRGCLGWLLGLLGR